jgi:hypothetical protein
MLARLSSSNTAVDGLDAGAVASHRPSRSVGHGRHRVVPHPKDLKHSALIQDAIADEVWLHDCGTPRCCGPGRVYTVTGVWRDHDEEPKVITSPTLPIPGSCAIR